MKSYRLNRLFHPRSRRCFDVAIDHGFFNEFSFLGGIENVERAVAVGQDVTQGSLYAMNAGGAAARGMSA